MNKGAAVVRSHSRYIASVSRFAPRRGRSLGVLALASLPALLLATHASAQQPTLAGSWSASPMSESVKVDSWVDECGPKPKSSSSPGGGYKISIAGDELVFSGGRAFRTDQCWDMGLARRVSHSATPSIRWWKTRCESPPGDPRKAAITTVVRAVDDDTIVLSETAHYTFNWASGSCSASVERSRTFKIVSREGAAPAASPSPTPTAAPTPTPTPTTVATPKPTLDCATVGAPATLEVKPRKKVVRPGEQFDFHARILDAKGCEVPAGKTTFRLAPESSAVNTVTVEANGRVKVAADAEPVIAVLIVEGATKSAKVELEVVSDQRYAELLASGAGDAGSDEQGVAVVLESGGGGGAATVVDPGKQESKRFRFAWLAIAGGICSLLGLGAIVLWRRGNAEAQRAAAELAERRAAREAEEAARRVAAEQAAAAAARQPPPAPMAAGAPVAFRPKGRICPICGTRYEGEAAFCSKDGIALVPLN